MKVLSLFDGMACGMLAMQVAGIEVDRYVAFEIDKYAVQTSSHNFPMIEHRGDVFHADFTEFSGFDFLVGGSPCTYWSIAQKNNRETEASGMGWELFSQYVRAVKEAQPRYFIYENNKSMSKAIRESITKTFGFEPICINSALVSAQNRQRLYWVGKRNPDGTYSKVHVDQPEDRGILLKDVIDTGEPINTTADGDKARTLMAGYYKYGTATLITNEGFTGGTTAVAEPVNITATGKSRTLIAGYHKQGIENCCGIVGFGSTGVAEPVAMRQVGRRINEDGHRDDYNTDLPHIQRYEVNEDPQKTNCVSTVTKDNVIAEAVLCGTNPCYAIPCEWDDSGRPTKAISAADGKTYPVYEVRDGKITIKGKQYPIKLVDGFYIIRKLTVTECKRLQTVPEWYEFPVSDTQAYKMLGNGWTVDVIAHLISATQAKTQ